MLHTQSQAITEDYHDLPPFPDTRFVELFPHLWPYASWLACRYSKSVISYAHTETVSAAFTDLAEHSCRIKKLDKLSVVDFSNLHLLNFSLLSKWKHDLHLDLRMSLNQTYVQWSHVQMNDTECCICHYLTKYIQMHIRAFASSTFTLVRRSVGINEGRNRLSTNTGALKRGFLFHLCGFCLESARCGPSQTMKMRACTRRLRV